MIKTTHLHAVEILDSRGRPTVAATMGLADGSSRHRFDPVRGFDWQGRSQGAERSSRSLPGPGMPEGGREHSRHDRKGCRRPRVFAARKIWTSDLECNSMERRINRGWAPTPFWRPRWLSLGRLRPIKASSSYEYFARFAPEGTPALPRLSVNLFSGGKHAFGQVAIQDVLVVPRGRMVSGCKPGHDLRHLPDGGRNGRETIQHQSA